MERNIEVKPNKKDSLKLSFFYLIQKNHDLITKRAASLSIIIFIKFTYLL